MARIPGLTLSLSPERATLDRVADDKELFCMIRDDLAQRFPRTLTAGRHSTAVKVVLRMLAVRHLYNLSYAQTELQVADSLVLRQFCRVCLQPVPDHSPLWKGASTLRLQAQIQPKTLQVFNDRVVTIANAGYAAADAIMPGSRGATVSWTSSMASITAAIEAKKASLAGSGGA